MRVIDTSLTDQNRFRHIFSEMAFKIHNEAQEIAPRDDNFNASRHRFTHSYKKG